MKKILFLSLTALILGCTPVKHTLAETKTNEMTSKFIINSFCPIEGSCKVDRIPNVSLSVAPVEEGNRGEVFYELLPSENTDVVIYTYKKHTDDVLMDGFYREEIIFEVPKARQRLLLEHINLQDVKMIFGRFCYCKGETGYYKVKRGTADIKYSQKQIKASINVNVLDVPQVTSKVSFTVD